MNGDRHGGQMDQGVGREVKRLREEKNWSMAKLAVEADMSVSGVSMIENGKRNLTTTTLGKIAKALEVEVVDLFPKGASQLSLEALTVGNQPAPTFKLEDLPEEARRQLAERGFSDAYFVPLEEGEEEDKVTLEIRYVRLFEEGEPILQAMRKASPEATAEPQDYGAVLEELGFPPEQIEAWRAQNEQDEEFIARELEKMSAKDFLEALIASPAGLRRIREYYRKAEVEAATPTRSESA
jgi:transcriptional regulator with XRE-family HTH domain